MPGEWIGATEEGALYVCVQAPDIMQPVTPDVPGCTFPDETPYLTSKTAAFGPVEVPAGTVFLMSDDREDLSDSRPTAGAERRAGRTHHRHRVATRSPCGAMTARSARHAPPTAPVGSR